MWKTEGVAIVRPNKQQQRREKSTQALLDAAGELVLEGGFSAMTFAAIGERAGFSRAMVTARFGSRQGLVEELIQRLVVPCKERTYPAGHTNTGMESVLALVDSTIDRTESNSKQLRILNALMFGERRSSIKHPTISIPTKMSSSLSG